MKPKWGSGFQARWQGRCSAQGGRVVAIADRHAADLEVVADIRAAGAASLRTMAVALNTRVMLTRWGGE